MFIEASMDQTKTESPQQGHYIKANELNMYYQESGSGKPLILLHGGTVSSNMWLPFLPAFVLYFRVIAPDSRGHGKTNNPSGKLSYHLMADDIAAFIKALGLTKPLVFGYSDGGQVALEIGMRYPTLTGGIILGATEYKLSETSINFFKALGFERPGVVNIEKIQRDNPELITLLKSEHMGNGDPGYWKTLLKQYSALWLTARDYTADDFHKITEPTLILQGDRDEIVELGQAIEMYRFIPDAELAILPNSRQSSPNMEILLKIVSDFFIRHIPAD
jgi:pimeloyl-ACP methyl ester carboxylesterase